MAWTEAQKRYAQSEKGKAARAKYMAKRKARLADVKQLDVSTNDPKPQPELTKMSKEVLEKPEV